mmetsp:Transcript_43734/g.102921  ORF Transcript_43734/g.102921 Transcript_43734/m.102921 type:complete len:687 (+) Transcript_43734:599-2659(+)
MRHELLEEAGLDGFHLVEEHVRPVFCHVEAEEHDQAPQELAVARGRKLLEPVKGSAGENWEEFWELGGGDVAEDGVEDGKGVVVRHLGHHEELDEAEDLVEEGLVAHDRLARLCDVRLHEAGEGGLVGLGGPEGLLEEGGEDLEVDFREGGAAALEELRDDLHEVGLELRDLLLQHRLERRHHHPLHRHHRRLVAAAADVLDDRGEGLEDEVVEGGVLGRDVLCEALAQLAQDPRQLLHQHLRHRRHVRLSDADDAHDALHDVGVLLAGLVGEALEEVGQEGLEHGLDVSAADARHRAVAHREEALDAARRVGVHDNVGRGEEHIKDGEEHAERLLRELVPERDEELEQVRHQDRVLRHVGGGHVLKVREHVGLEEGPDVHVRVRRDHALALGLGLDRERDEEVDRRVLGLPLAVVGLVLREQALDLRHAQLRDRCLKVHAHGVHQAARDPPPRVGAHPLEVPLHVLQGVVLEVFLVALADQQSGDHHIVHDAMEVRGLEELVVRALEDRGEEADRGDRELVELRDHPEVREQRPHVLDEGREVLLEHGALVGARGAVFDDHNVLVRVQVDRLADRALHLVHRRQLLLVLLRRELRLDRVREREQLVEARHPRVEVVLKHLGDVLEVEVVEQARDQLQRLEQHIEDLLVPGLLRHHRDAVGVRAQEALVRLLQHHRNLCPQLVRVA